MVGLDLVHSQFTKPGPHSELQASSVRSWYINIHRRFTKRSLKRPPAQSNLERGERTPQFLTRCLSLLLSSVIISQLSLQMVLVQAPLPSQPVWWQRPARSAGGAWRQGPNRLCNAAASRQRGDRCLETRAWPEL